VKDVQARDEAQAISQLQVRKVSRVPLRLAQLIWRGMSALILFTLAVFEPVVRYVLVSLGVLGLFVTIVFGFFLEMEEFPKWSMLGLCGSCFLILATYYLAMRASASLYVRSNS